MLRDLREQEGGGCDGEAVVSPRSGQMRLHSRRRCAFQLGTRRLLDELREGCAKLSQEESGGLAADRGTDLFGQGLTPLPRPLGGRLSTQPFRKTIHCPVPRSLGNGVTVFTADGLSAPSSEGQQQDGPPAPRTGLRMPHSPRTPPPPSPSLQPPPSPLLLLLPPARVPVCTDANSGCASRTDLGSGRRPCQQGLTALLSPAGVQPRLPVTQEGRVVRTRI